MSDLCRQLKRQAETLLWWLHCPVNELPGEVIMSCSRFLMCCDWHSGNPPPSVARWLLLVCRALDWVDLPCADIGTLINDLYRGDSSKCLLTAGWLFLAQTKANRLAVWGEHTQLLLKEKHKVAVSEGWELRANSTLHFLTEESVVRHIEKLHALIHCE